MNLDSYGYVYGDTPFDFRFESWGPKGIIKKGIKYSFMSYAGNICFNIAFGDIDSKTGEIDDYITSNNGDRNKIISTIAMNILDFSEKYPGMRYYFEGSTHSRTRLYQMSLSKYIGDINKIFELYGRLDNSWELFTSGRNYEAFIFYRKSY